MEKFDGKKLRDLREAKGWNENQAALALIRVGYDRPATKKQWAKWETNWCAPAYSAFRAIETLFKTKQGHFDKEV